MYSTTEIVESVRATPAIVYGFTSASTALCQGGMSDSLEARSASLTDLM
ncbi:hypothetical protein N790_02625 [Arenimonas malthae CC-JY-1]|uniref:Uncharacterized protein n=1 Tax=Arenimonas malthae CC-JY-1 TaxID=1384054 RepID=A0A091AV23_9GAMM|nr:hypothetical protein N790_02625 [Arenimonas malthae CC-JY-1]